MKAAIDTTQQVICPSGSAASAQPSPAKHTAHKTQPTALQRQPE